MFLTGGLCHGVVFHLIFLLVSAGTMEKVVVFFVLLPRSGPREEEVWSTWLEHPLRVQRD